MGRGQHWLKRLVMAIVVIAPVSASAAFDQFKQPVYCNKNGHSRNAADLKQDRWDCRKELLGSCDENYREQSYQYCMAAKGWECGSSPVP
jgi:hypothetical protein